MDTITIPLPKDYVETKLAIGFKLYQDGIGHNFYIPKSLIQNSNWKELMQVEIPQRFYDKKVDELF